MKIASTTMALTHVYLSTSAAAEKKICLVTKEAKRRKVMKMNHDYAHCADFTEGCPKDCFRAQLCRDLKSKAGMLVSFMHFKDTEECPMSAAKNNELKITVQTKYIVPNTPDGQAIASGIATAETNIGSFRGLTQDTQYIYIESERIMPVKGKGGREC